MTTDKPCVTIIGHGFTEHATLEEWARVHVQDYEVALDVAEVLRFGTYEWNPDEAEFYAEFEVSDPDEFMRQLAALKVLAGRVD